MWGKKKIKITQTSEVPPYLPQFATLLFGLTGGFNYLLSTPGEVADFLSLSVPPSRRVLWLENTEFVVVKVTYQVIVDIFFFRFRHCW